MTGAVLALVVIAGLAVNGLRLRTRVPPALPGEEKGPGEEAGPGPGCGWSWFIAQGVPLGGLTRRQATGYATAQGLDLVDVVPAGLPATAARDLLRVVSARGYRSGGPLTPGRSAGAAVLAARPLAERARITVPDAPDPADVMAAAGKLRPYAARGAAIMVAPGLRPAGADLARRRARLRASGVLVPAHLALDAVPWALVVLTLLLDWEWGLASLAAYCLQPYLVFAGTALRPGGRHTAALLRPAHAPYVWARTAAGRWRSAADRDRDAERALAVPWYRDALAAGTGRFFEKRRPACPWCGSAALAVLVRSPDLVLSKPGRFTLDRCGGCGHVFQNPRLTPDGLGFYYRDAYDGLGAAGAESIFLTGGDSYRGRARMLAPFTTPKAWLDVGAGLAHFCAVAREVWPDTTFDGLDQGAGIEEAERRGWIGIAYRGMFPDLAAGLSGRYDVVSMHHYLEHTRDPGAELDAAARVLGPGGYLLIEVPDPQWPLARLLRRYWMPWFQPQHQHLMPVGNLTRALTERGLRPVAVERGAAHQPNDFVAAASLFVSRLAPDRALPWSARPPAAVLRGWGALAWTLGAPVILVGLLLDLTLVRALARRWDRGNAYRVLARREDRAEPAECR